MHLGFYKLAGGGERELQPKPKPQLTSAFRFKVSSLGLYSNNAMREESKNLNT